MGAPAQLCSLPPWANLALHRFLFDLEKVSIARTLRARWVSYPALPFYRAKSEVQNGETTWLKSCNETMAEAGLRARPLPPSMQCCSRVGEGAELCAAALGGVQVGALQASPPRPDCTCAIRSEGSISPYGRQATRPLCEPCAVTSGSRPHVTSQRGHSVVPTSSGLRNLQLSIFPDPSCGSARASQRLMGR